MEKGTSSVQRRNNHSLLLTLPPSLFCIKYGFSTNDTIFVTAEIDKNSPFAPGRSRSRPRSLRSVTSFCSTFLGFRSLGCFGIRLCFWQSRWLFHQPLPLPSARLFMLRLSISSRRFYYKWWAGNTIVIVRTKVLSLFVFVQTDIRVAWHRCWCRIQVFLEGRKLGKVWFE